MRPVWKGALSFGLVHIPIRMYRASLDKALSFRLLHKKDLSEVRYARICKKEGKEIPWEEIVKGFEHEKGKYVVLTDEDFKRADVKRTETIEIVTFTDESGVDTIYYDTPYYLEPENGASAAYGLFLEALKRTKKVAIGRFVFHHHEYIGAIKPYQNALVLHQLRYADELKEIKELTIAKKPITKTELALAMKLIDELSHPFHPEKYSDTYIDEIKAIIKRKAKGLKLPAMKKTKSTKVHDLVSLLEKSLKKDKKKKAA